MHLLFALIVLFCLLLLLFLVFSCLFCLLLVLLFLDGHLDGLLDDDHLLDLDGCITLRCGYDILWLLLRLHLHLRLHLLHLQLLLLLLLFLALLALVLEALSVELALQLPLGGGRGNLALVELAHRLPKHGLCLGQHALAKESLHVQKQLVVLAHDPHGAPNVQPKVEPWVVVGPAVVVAELDRQAQLVLLLGLAVDGLVSARAQHVTQRARRVHRRLFRLCLGCGRRRRRRIGHHLKVHSAQTGPGKDERPLARSPYQRLSQPASERCSQQQRAIGGGVDAASDDHERPFCRAIALPRTAAA